MTERPRKWARFARMLPPDVQSEQQVLEWLRDEEIDRVIAYLKTWNKFELEELREYKVRLGHWNKYFNSRGDLTPAGFQLSYKGTQHEKDQLDAIEDELGWRIARVRRMEVLITYAKNIVEGTLQIEEADQAYDEAIKALGL